MYRLFLFYYLTFSFANSQARIGEWKALTSILNVRDIISTEEAIYAASGGGILEIKNNQYSTYTTINGLNGVNLSCMALDHQSNLWIGGQSPFGFLQVYDIQKMESIIENQTKQIENQTKQIENQSKHIEFLLFRQDKIYKSMPLRLIRFLKNKFSTKLRN